MDCLTCGFANPAEMHFCGQCGGRLSHRCPQCGFDNSSDIAFCGQCGTTLTEQTPADLGPLSPPKTYIPQHLAEKIRISRSTLEGERKQVTVLFADLKDSMELLADRDPEEARNLLDPILERMITAVHSFEGTVNQVMGDGIMALFGAPIAHEDHAVRACYAALHMQGTIGRYAEELRRQKGLDVWIRVGLNSGEVVVRAIGNDLHMDYTAVGQTTHLAARMEQMAMPGSVLITASVLRLVEGYVRVEPLGAVPIKGMREATTVYKVTGTGPVRTRLQASIARGLTQFVGRQDETATLSQGLARAGSGHGQVMAVIGEPGVGKSRLFWEFTQSYRTQGWLLLESRAVSYGKATPYLPVIELLKTYFQIEDRDDLHSAREKVSGKLQALDQAGEFTMSALLALLGVPVEDTAWHALEPLQRRQEMLDAVKRLLLSESRVQPLLLVFEDLHGIDTETQAFLDHLIESLPTTRLCLLVNYRPEYRHSWGERTYYTQLRLDPLPLRSAEELLQDLLGDGADLRPLKQLIIARTEGNPFFLEESVRTLIEARLLVGERGNFRLAQGLPSTQVPATVQAVLASRIDRLPSDQKRLLQTAAVVGPEVPFRLLQAIAEMPQNTLDHHLVHLQSAGFLYETHHRHEREYSFEHALTHEVAYGSLLQEQRRTLHAGIVSALEQLYHDRRGEQVERLAYHALRGERWEKVFIYSREAGAKAFERSANREAVAYFEQALEASRHLPETRDMQEQAIDLRIDLRNALWQLGEPEKILGYLREAEGLAQAIDDQRRLGQLSAFMSSYFWMRGCHDRALEPGHRALAIAQAFGDLALEVETNFRLGQAYFSLGDYRRACDFLRRNMSASQPLPQHFSHASGRLPPHVVSVFSHTWLVGCLVELGLFPEGIARGEDAARVAEAVDQPFSLIAAYLGLGYAYLNKGDLDQAIPRLERALELCRAMKILVWFPAVASSLGMAYALSARMAEALELLESAVERAISINSRHHAIWVVELGQAYLLGGQMDDAVRTAHHALELAREYKERGWEAYALRLLGDIAARRHPPDGELAEYYSQGALALTKTLGMRPLQAHCHLGLGTLYAKIGQREQARAELSAAIMLYRAMAMTFWLPQAEATLAQVEGR